MEAKQLVNDEKVSEYLRTHPDFLIRYPELLPMLEIPHQTGKVVSLVERQVKSLRDENRRLQGQLIDVLRTAQENERLYRDCNQLLNRWMLVDGTDLLLKQINSDMKKVFDIDAVKVITNEDQQAKKIANEFSMSFPDNQILCGPSDSKMIAKIFPKHQQLLSMAIAPLGHHASFGLLILANKQVDGFSATMGTIFLEQITAVLHSLLVKPID